MSSTKFHTHTKELATVLLGEIQLCSTVCVLYKNSLLRYKYLICYVIETDIYFKTLCHVTLSLFNELFGGRDQYVDRYIRTLAIMSV